MATVIASRHEYPEPAGFTIDRKKGHKNWTFLHFITPIQIMVNGEIVHTKQNACIIFAPNEPQFFHSDDDVIHDWMHFDDVPSDFLSTFKLQTGKIYYPEKHEFITRIVREIENEFNSSFLGRDKLLSLKIDELFIKLYRNCFENTVPSVPINVVSSLRFIREKMFKTISDNHTVQTLANSVGLSQSRFFSVYKSQTFPY